LIASDVIPGFLVHVREPNCGRRWRSVREVGQSRVRSEVFKKALCFNVGSEEREHPVLRVSIAGAGRPDILNTFFGRPFEGGLKDGFFALLVWGDHSGLHEDCTRTCGKTGVEGSAAVAER